MNQLQETFSTFLTTGLNEQQRNAVTQPNRAILIVAGAGSGKTRVITSRIAHLIINQGVNPRSIVALTFTNKAAGEMKERLHKQFEGHYKLPFIGTFHSYCLQLLRTHSTLLPHPTFTIMDADDQLDLIKKIIKKYALAKHITASNLVYQISKYKNRLFSSPALAEELGFTPMMREIYYEYETEKANAHCYDFDDLILTVLKMLASNDAFRHSFQAHIKHILVDEYQDTSDVQHQLLLAMSQRNKELIMDSICAVGDEDQSIYSWRGATVANMLKFEHDFAPVVTIKIEQNYRSVQPILQAANEVIANNTQRNPKNLWSTREAKNRMLLVSCQSGDQEAEAIANLVTSVASKKKHNEVAVLYRTHFQSRSLEEALIHKSIPYKIIGGIRFYERKEVKDLIAYLRLIVNPYDKISLLRVINTPARGLGQKFEEQLLQAWSVNPFLDMHQMLSLMMAEKEFGLTGIKLASVKNFIDFYAGIDRTLPPSKILDNVIDHINYPAYLNAAYDPQEAQAKTENVQELMQAVLAFERKQSYTDTIANNGFPLETFLHEVSLLQEAMEKDSQQSLVQMMTLHAAKGLEFDTVIIAGLEEGLLPSQKSLNAAEDLEEERRLMYVGMTRAKEHLILFNAFSRFTFGQVVDQAPSRFLKEIPKHLIHKLDLEDVPRYTVRSLFDNWLEGRSVNTPAIPVHYPQAAVQRSNYTPSPQPSFSRPPITTSSMSSSGIKTPFFKKQTVYHAKFGPGIVTDVEKAPDEDYYVTALFKVGKKKILGKFLERK
jgi:DNA helicase II / ATP-dependent DNA helicase PcrA